eukprot:365803_1
MVCMITVLNLFIFTLHHITNARILPKESSIFVSDTLPKEQLAATIGNGYIGMTVGTQSQSQYMYINGIWNGIDRYQNGKSSLKAHKAAIPNSNYISLTFKNYDANDINITYKLDVNNAIFSFIYQHKQNYWSVEQIIYTHRLYKNLAITQINVNINNNTINNNLLIEVNNLNYNQSSTDVNMTDMTEKNAICKNNNYLCYSGWTQLSESNSSLIEIGILTFKNSTNSYILNISKDSNKQQIFYYPTVSLTSFESNNIINDMITMLTKDLLPIQNKWLQQHINEWEMNIWSKGRIDIIDNNITMSSNVYASLYYIISSIRNDWCFGISPGSLATNGYKGRVFWDQDIWVFPSLLLLHNTLSHCQLMYRYNTLNGAYFNANITGYINNSARYPWQSGSTGIELVPDTAPGNHSILINGAIAWTINKYYEITNNKTWLKHIGFPMLFAMSNYYIQRVNKLQNNLYSYLNVTGADQTRSAVNVNSSGFTNMVAIETLNYSMKAANILNISYPNNWNEINYDNILIIFDSKNNYHPEYDGYKMGQHLVQPGIIYFGYPYNYFYRISDDKDIYLNDLNIYYNVSTKHHTMQWSMFMINYMILNKYDLAMESLKYTLSSLVSNSTDPNPFKVWTEGSDGSGCDHFLSDQGGFLQTFLFGFGGFSINSNYLQINAQFMPYKQMNFIGVDYQNNNIDFNMYNISQSNILVNITVTDCIDIRKYLLLVLYDNNTKNYSLNINQTVTISNDMQPAKIVRATLVN